MQNVHHPKAQLQTNFSQKPFPLLRARSLALFVLAAASLAMHAATVWTGPTITYTQPGTDPTQPTNQDRLTAKVWITRAVSAGIFNAFSETSYAHNVSPAGTEWAVGNLADYASLSYSDWETAGGGNPVLNLPGQQLVAHLLAEDIYLAVKFTALGGHFTGGFSYLRSTPPPNVAPGVSILSPADGAAYNGPTTITIQALATDSDGSVTNVQFFDGVAPLGSVTALPYQISSLLTHGSHVITAVAWDNTGALATSPPISLTVTGGLYLPAITLGNISLLLQPIATGLSAPDYAISPPGNTTRLFVVEQKGLLRIIQNGALLPDPALDIQSRVQPPLNATNANDERGLLGLAFHPGFNVPSSPGYQTLYTYNSEQIPAGSIPTYPVPTTATNNYKNVVNEWKISADNPNLVDPASRREIISFGKNAGNHNGGTITFGPDGYLYLGLGDGGNANDVGPSHIEPGGNAQNLATPLGKMLRIDPLHPTLTPNSSDSISPNGQYRIPATNPFRNPGQVPEIFAYGLRNPYRFAFDRLTGDLICADVGQNTIEEIDRIVLGGNYGWAIKEGDFLFNRTNNPLGNAGTVGAAPGNRSPGAPAGLIDPISGPLGTLEYDHGDGISITGGFVYRGSAIPELFGKYVFGDLALQAAPVRANGRLFYADLQTGLIKLFALAQYPTNILPDGLTVHGFGEDAEGELYALVTNTSANGTGGIIYKLASLRLTVQRSANLFDLSWPVAGPRLEVQTNSPGVGLNNNWIPLAGSETTNHIVFPADPANGSLFFRLTLP